MSQYKIAVIGEKTDVLGFLAVGFDAFPADDPEHAEAILGDLVKTEKYAVIFIKDTMISEMQTAIAKYKFQPIPAIIALPGSDGSSGFGLSQIKESVEKAIGADILFKDN